MQQIKNQIIALTRNLLNLTHGLTSINETLKTQKASEVKVVIDIDKIKGDKPVKGVDYFTEAELKVVAEEASKLIRVPEDGKNGKPADEKKLYNKLYILLSRMIPKAFDEKAFKASLLKEVISPQEHKKTLSKAILEATKGLAKADAVAKITVTQKTQAFENVLSDRVNIKLIARALEKLKGKDRLDAKAIKNLPFLGGGGGTSTTTSSTGGVGAWSTPPETVSPTGSVVVFTVGAVAPTDLVSDGILLFQGFGYTFAGGQVTLDNGPTQFIRYR